jgi:hypothetical protein
MADDELFADGARSDTPERGPLYRQFQEATAKHVAFVSWVVFAACYGFQISEWGSMSVDTATASPYPDYWAFFMLSGLALGVALSASIVVTMQGEENE